MSSSTQANLGLRAVIAGTRARVRWGVRRAQAEREKGGARFAGLVALGGFLGLAVFTVTFAGGRYLQDNDAVAVAHSAVSFGMLGLTVAVVVSSIGHAATSFFGARDLWFWDASPTPSWARFIDRLEATAAGALPATLAFGSVALSGLLVGVRAGALGVARGGFVLLCCGLTGLAVGVTVAHLGGAVLPAGKLRRASLVVLGALTFVALVVLRRLGLERVVTEEGAAELLSKAKDMGGVGPSSLVHNLAGRFALEGAGDALVGVLAWTAGGLAIAFASHRLLYRRARDRGADESPRGLAPDSLAHRALEAALARLPTSWQPVARKDALGFFRDPAQWSQLVLLLGVGGVYLVNCQALNAGFEGLFMRELVLAAVHVGVVTFIAAGLSARFGFTQLALDGPSAWILEAAPLSPRDLVRAKWAGALPVVAGFPSVVGTLGAVVLDLSLFATASAAVIIALVSVALTALGVGRGAIEPAYDAPTVSEMAMGPGALATMGTAVVLCGLSAFGTFVALGLVMWSRSAMGWVFAVQGAIAPIAIAGYVGWRALFEGEQAVHARRAEGAVKTSLQ